MSSAFLLLLLAAAGPAGPDSDGDGISDADEDTNHNGIVDPGESDPKQVDTDGDNVPDSVERRLGTNPLDRADVPPIPEPLYIDLVRNLGSKQGELEINVLSFTTYRKEPTVRWGPEIEYTPLSGLGLEFELPLIDHEVEAVKPGVQVTLGSLAARRLEFGVLGTHAQNVQELGSFSSLSALVGVRFSPQIQALWIVGPTVTVERSRPARMGGLMNPTLFYQLSRVVFLGVEMGYRVTAYERSAQLVLPQVHLDAGQWDLQIGVGGTNEGDGRLRPATAIRICYER